MTDTLYIRDDESLDVPIIYQIDRNVLLTKMRNLMMRKIAKKSTALKTQKQGLKATKRKTVMKKK